MTSPFFFSVLFVHLVSLIVGFGSVIMIDTCGLLWLRKKITLSFLTRVARITQKLIWLGWSGMVISGIPMLYIKGYIDGLTWIKIFLVALIGLNGIYLHIIKKNLESLRNEDRIPLLMIWRIGFSTCISQVGWWGALFIGFVHRHISHNIAIPENPFPYIMYASIIVAVLYIGGEVFLSQKRPIA